MKDLSLPRPQTKRANGLKMGKAARVAKLFQMAKMENPTRHLRSLPARLHMEPKQMARKRKHQATVRTSLLLKMEAGYASTGLKETVKTVLLASSSMATRMTKLVDMARVESPCQMSMSLPASQQVQPKQIARKQKRQATVRTSLLLKIQARYASTGLKETVKTCKNGSACNFLHAKDTRSTNGKGGKGADPAKGASRGSSGKSSTEPRDSKGKEAKKDTKILQCLECKQKFKDWETMCKKHFLCQGRAPLCLCVECNKTFADDIDCAQHQSAKGHRGMARVNDEEEPNSVCGQCGKEFDTRRACEQHQDSLGHRNFPACSMCGRDFPNMEALAQHQQAKGHVGHFWVMEILGERASAVDEVFIKWGKVAFECACCERLFTGFARETSDSLGLHFSLTGHAGCNRRDDYERMFLRQIESN